MHPFLSSDKSLMHLEDKYEVSKFVAQHEPVIPNNIELLIY